jgi:adenylosuccinate synthase
MENDAAKRKIGTTGRGIGPTYADKISRSGIRIIDLFNEDILRDKIISALDSKNRILSRYECPTVTVDEVIAEFAPYLERLKPMVSNTVDLINKAIDNGKTVLFEGGQATMLDIDFGTYPFVTSSNATAGGAITGSGVGPTKIASVLGVVKAYTTRVGEGPFPTELKLPEEVVQALLNGEDVPKIVDPQTDAEFGQFLLQVGGEFGVTTGRARRCGWYDAVVARWAAQVNGLTDFVLTKLDVLTGIEKIKVCVAYDVDGVRVEDMPVDEADFERAQPIYEEFDGWTEDICAARKFEDLPTNAQKYVRKLEEISGCRISVIGVGPGRDAIIELHDIKR